MWIDSIDIGEITKYVSKSITLIRQITESIISEFTITPKIPEKNIPLPENIATFSILFGLIVLIWLGHSYYRAYVLSRNCKVVFTWTDEPSKVGETAGFAIIFYQLDGTPHDETTLLELIEKISITIKLKSGKLVPHKIRPLLEDGDYVSMAEFKVDAAGVYQISLIYEGFPIIGSPFSKVFLPGVIDPSKSYVDKPPNDSLVCTEGKTISLEIVAVDKVGNKCRTEDIEFQKFDLSVSLKEVKPSRCDDDIIKEFIYSFDKKEVEGISKVFFKLETKTPGIFSVRILYDNCLLSNGFFTAISVTAEEEKLINRVLNGDQEGNQCYPNVKAKLIAVGTNNHEVPLDIFVEVTPRNLTIRQVYWNVLSSKLANFCIASRTQIRIIYSCPKTESYLFSVSDEIQNTIILEMGASEARIFFMLFSHFTTVKTGRMIHFEDKETFFYNTLAKSLPDTRFCYHVISVFRNQIIKSSYRETKYLSTDDWRKSFTVSFINENVSQGCSVKDWLITLCDAFFEDDRCSAMFVSSGDSRLVHPNCATFRSKKYPVPYYYFAGKVVGKCLIEASVNSNFKGLMSARFTRSFLAQLIGAPVSYLHLELDNPELYNGTVSNVSKNDMATANLTFTEPVYDRNGKFIKNNEIVPNGSFRYVNNDNKEEYLNTLAIHQLQNKVQEEVAAFRDGILSLVPEDLLTIFSENELELLMCGNTKFNVIDLKRNHVAGRSQTVIRHQGRLMDWLWKVLSKMSAEEQSKFLQFTTGTCSLPRGGFKELRPKFKILISESMNQMPTANKQRNELTISDQSSFDEFEESLLKTIR